jgi:DNA polymerase III subunit chi
MPQRVDFYLLESNEPNDDILLVCKLLEKAYHRGHRVFVYCKNIDEAHQLDELLWTFKDDSFIPHNIQGEGPEPPPPIQIGFDAEPRGFNDILINLSPVKPSFSDRFKRVMEIIAADKSAKEAGRDRYRQYRAKGHTIHTHNI